MVLNRDLSQKSSVEEMVEESPPLEKAVIDEILLIL